MEIALLLSPEETGYPHSDPSDSDTRAQDLLHVGSELPSTPQKLHNTAEHLGRMDATQTDERPINVRDGESATRQLHPKTNAEDDLAGGATEGPPLKRRQVSDGPIRKEQTTSRERMTTTFICQNDDDARSGRIANPAIRRKIRLHVMKVVGDAKKERGSRRDRRQRLEKTTRPGSVFSLEPAGHSSAFTSLAFCSMVEDQVAEGYHCFEAFSSARAPTR